MEFNEQIIQEIGITEEQATKLTQLTSEYEAEMLRKEVDPRAVEQAEKILDGAAKKVIELTGIQREKGQKIADYISFAGEKYFEGRQSSLERKQSELEEKLKNTKGDEVLKQQLEETKQQIDALKQKEAEYDEWAKNDYKGKYEKTTEELTGLKKRLAFNSVKPSFPDTVNKYEADAKWKEFINKVEDKNTIVLDDDGNGWAVDKENEFKKYNLSDLVEKDESIRELIKGRNASGLGGKPKEEIQLEGVPFKVPENATSKERTEMIRNYLSEQGINHTNKEYAKRFAELNKKILEKIPASK